MKRMIAVVLLFLFGLTVDLRAQATGHVIANWTVHATTSSVQTAVAVDTIAWNWIYMRFAGDDCYVVFNGTATFSTNTPVVQKDSTFSFQKTDMWSGYVTFIPVHSNATFHGWGSK